jgi:hypothetical protein
MPVNSIKVPQLRQWLKDLGEELGPGTIGLVWGYLSTISAGGRRGRANSPQLLQVPQCRTAEAA